MSNVGLGQFTQRQTQPGMAFLVIDLRQPSHHRQTWLAAIN
jgi:hypothetical protein